MKKIILIITLLLIFCGVFANPYGKSGGGKKENINPPSKLTQWNSEVQRQYREKITDAMKELKSEDNKGILFLIIGLTFIYGMLHSLGPGHGKFILSSLVISGRHKLLKVIGAGYFMGTLHALSATTVIMVIYLTLKSRIFTRFSDTESIIKIITAVLIILIGIYNLVMANHREKKEKNSDTGDNSGFFNVVFAAGIVPCPATSLILLFAINLKILYLGLICAAVMAIGMGTGITLSALIAYFARD
ncbi:MAG: nickel/cobalt transporter, partial [Candidatus Muiribacteriaceae bacterium]